MRVFTVFLYTLLQVVDVSAQDGCIITPINPTTLTTAGGILASGTENVMIQCNCTDYQFIFGVALNVTWYDPSGINLLFSNSVPKTPHITSDGDDTNIVLVIPTFNDSYDGTYTCGEKDDNYPPGAPNATITLTIDSISAPTNVRATLLSPRSVEITWQPSSSSGVIGYLISYTTTASYTSGGSVTVAGGSIMNHTFNENLEEDTYYTFTVQATTSDNRMSANSNEVSVITDIDSPSSPPQNITIKSANPASLIVSWNPPLEIYHNGPLIGYVIHYSGIVSNELSLSFNITSDNTYTITGIVAYVNYSVIVAAANDRGTGVLSDPVIGRSGEDVPSEPQSLETISVNSNSVTLQWRPPETPNGVVTQYSIQRNGTNVDNFNSSVLMYTIEGLSSDTVYVLQLRAHTVVGAGPPSSETVLTSLGPVLGVTVHDESLTSSTFTLTWMEVSLTNSRVFSHYTVFYLPVSGPYGLIMASNRRKRQSAQAGELTMNFTGTIGTLTNLYGAVTYRIQMAVVGTFNGQEIIGDRSTAMEITTLESMPTAPRNLVYGEPVHSVTGNMFNVTLTWSRPDPPNGVITWYNVSYIGINTQHTITQYTNEDSDVESSHTWSNLIQGNYHFSVVAFTSKGPGEAAIIILPSSSQADSEDDSDDNNEMIIALAALLVIAVLGLVSCAVINVLLVMKLKQLRHDPRVNTGIKCDVTKEADPAYQEIS